VCGVCPSLLLLLNLTLPWWFYGLQDNCFGYCLSFFFLFLLLFLSWLVGFWMVGWFGNFYSAAQARRIFKIQVATINLTHDQI
jgi:hypothetical protein